VTISTASGTYRIVAPDEFSASWGVLKEFAGVWEDTHHDFRTKREAVKFVTETL
jgi:hypothetical protein